MSEHLYRIDKFRVPPTPGMNFWRRFATSSRAVTHEQTSGPGVFNIVTTAEWESAEAMESAKQAAAGAI